MKKLTDAAAAALKLPPGKADHFVPDPGLKDFGVRLRPTGKKWSTLPKRLANGKQCRQSFGDVGQVPVDAARKAARQWLAAVALGQDRSAKKARARAEAEAQKLMVGPTVRRYLAIKQKELRPASFTSITHHLDTLWKGLHNKPLTSVTRSEVTITLEDLAGTRGRVCASAARSALRAFYSWGMSAGLAEANPAAGTKILRRGSSRARAYSVMPKFGQSGSPAKTAAPSATSSDC